MDGRGVVGLIIIGVFVLFVQFIIWLIPVVIALLCIAAIGFVAFSILVLFNKWLQRRKSEALAKAASALSTQLSGCVCEYQEKYCLVERVQLSQGAANSNVFVVHMVCIEEAKNSPSRRIEGLPSNHLRKHTKSLEILIPGQVSSNQSEALQSLVMNHPSLSFASPLSVEYRATRAAFDCHQEAAWAKGSLTKLQKLMDSINEALSRAEGNELIQPSVPRMKRTLSQIQTEREKILRYRVDCLQKLEKLDDFLSLPAAVRPLLDGDVGVFSPGLRGIDIKEVFNDVLLLAEAYESIN